LRPQQFLKTMEHLRYGRGAGTVWNDDESALALNRNGVDRRGHNLTDRTLVEVRIGRADAQGHCSKDPVLIPFATSAMMNDAP